MDVADLAFAIVGIGALAAALLPRLVDGRPLSAPIVFLGSGVALGLLPLDVPALDLTRNPGAAEHLTEVVVIVALMGAGLALDRRLGWRRWRNTWRLLLIAMPLTIAGIAALGWGVLGLTPAAALLLGAALAPTDPVLASEVQVSEPATQPGDPTAVEDEVRFSLTSEAGLNDALAFPFVMLAIALAEHGDRAGTWLLTWAAGDLVGRIAIGAVVGWLVGRALAQLFFNSRVDVLRLSDHREGFVAVAATFLAYGLAELAHGYGFLAVFVAAVVVRSSERFHEYHVVLHEFIEQVERLLTVLVLLIVGIALTDGVLATVGARDLLVAAVVLLVVRPATGFLSLWRGAGSKRERAAIAFFGVRGIGSIYYVAFALGMAEFADAEEVVGVIALVIAGSVVLHGMTAGPLMARFDARRERRRSGVTAGH